MPGQGLEHGVRDRPQRLLPAHREEFVALQFHGAEHAVHDMGDQRGPRECNGRTRQWRNAGVFRALLDGLDLTRTTQ